MLKPIYMKSIFLFCFTLLLISCSGDDDLSTSCGVLFPAKQIPWLRGAIDEFQKSDILDVTVEQGEYNSQTVFIITPCCLTCNFMAPPVYACDGKVVAGLNPSDENIQDRKVIWKSPADGANCW
jgi:hypothetical protein